MHIPSFGICLDASGLRLDNIDLFILLLDEDAHLQNT